ncbi:MAG TPA: hypothetical protein VGU71_16785 [Candidatus Dormibacteraeota bacterium]|nr:hypothetical protein [Candidatus Dormibacteraeota bacterium]
MKLAIRLILGVMVTLALVVGSACGASTSSSSSSSTSNSSPQPSTAPGGVKLDPQVSMPSGFPFDVPIYPGARLVFAGNSISNGTTTWSMTWQTVDSVDKVQAFYTAKLAQGDWTISFSGSSNGSYSAIFNRKSNSNVGGIMGVGTNVGITEMSLVLTNGA